MTDADKPGGSHANREDEPIRLKRDTDLSPEPAQPAHTLRNEWNRSGPEPEAYIPPVTSKPPPRQKPPTILDVFRFPFSLAGIIHFLIFWLGPFLLAFFTGFFGWFFYGRITIYAANTILYSYLLFYLSNCVIASARDERFAPDVSVEEAPDFPDLLGRVSLLIGSVLTCFGPVIFYVFYFYIWTMPPSGMAQDLPPQNDPIYWGLFGAGVLFFPMFLLASVMFDSGTALNPLLIIGSVISTFVPYCALALLFFSIGLLINYLVRFINGWGPAFLVWGAVIYLMFIAAYILGRFFRRYENRLNWEVKL